jgi:hypothetical protein
LIFPDLSDGLARAASAPAPALAPAEPLLADRALVSTVGPDGRPHAAGTNIRLPEPASAALLLTGIVGLLARRRLRRQSMANV